MAGIHAGTDTYGKVKKVGPTSVVTKFAMLSALPIWPLQSYFYAGPGESQFQGVPLLGGVSTTEIRGLPLARIDWFSVLMAYVRGFFGMLVIIGSMSVIGVIYSWNATHVDDAARTAMHVLFMLLCVGALGGLLTYCLPFHVSRRQRAIRLACGEVLGLCADPALIRNDVAQNIMSALTDREVSEDRGATRSKPRPVLAAVKLVRFRALIALGHDPAPLEVRTDELLAQMVNDV
jgi:hypothetical protein